MPMASEKERPRIIFVWITGWASGLRPSASIARPTRLPMAMAGPKAPRPMAMPAPMNFNPASLIANLVAPASWAATRAPSAMGGGAVAFIRLLGGMLAVRHRHHSEHKRQHGENERLDHADE